MRSLILIFEFRSSMIRAERDGLLERNLALFCKLLENSAYDKIFFYSYDPADRELLAQFHSAGRLHAGIQLLTPPKWLSGKLGALAYSIFGPLIHHRDFRNTKALHPLQVSGAWTALIGKLLFRTPVLFRCGYPLSVRFKQEGKTFNYAITRLLEKTLMHASDHAGVTSKVMQDYYSAMNPAAKISIMPNYVDMSAFSQMPSYDKSRPILFVGRLVEVKNIPSLIQACRQLGLDLHLFGKGPMEDELRTFAIKEGANVTFKGSVPNTDLAKLHHNYSIFVSCSLREGLPKAVVEAMASGLVVVGTKTDGLLELIEDGKTGHLIDGYDADAIAGKLDQLITDFTPEIGQAACRFVSEHYSLEYATKVTTKILDSIEKH